MEFRILGPLQVITADGPIALPGRRQRTVLAVLLANPDQVVPVEYLIDAVWDDHPPATARRQIHNDISALRRALSAGSADPVIVLDGPGYRARTRPGQVDAQAFRDHVTTGLSLAEEEPAAAVAELRAGLGLWRGPALFGLTGRIVESIAAGLGEQRLAAAERCFELQLLLGRHTEVVAELTDLVAAYPTQERLVEQLMLALYRCGRRSDALAVYQQLRQRLADDLGIDPVSPVRELYIAILRGDLTIDVPVDAAAPSAVDVPAQLPADIASFTGRPKQLKVLDTLLDADRTAMVLVAIAGMPGIGKTALAVHWAHRVAGRFPDGQLYVNLRGFDHNGSITTTGEAVRGFLDALGVPTSRIPADVEGQVSLFRSTVAGKRTLIIVDNARDADQVRPLLPGSPGCLAIVTSRNRLTGLVARDGAHPLALDVLTHDEARHLLARRLGPARVNAEPDATDDIITRCARLPLALVVAAARAAVQPALSLSALARQLEEVHGRLDALSGSDQASDVRAVFSWSYQALTPPAADLFRLLGLHPGPHISAAAAASLAGQTPAEASQVLAELVEAHLLDEDVPGRYTSHDLLRAYAADQARAIDPPQRRYQAVHRLLEHYLHSADAADRMLLRPHWDGRTRFPAPSPDAYPVRFTDREQALAWFTAEHDVLTAAVAQAAADGYDRHAWQLAWTLTTYLRRRGLWQDYIAVYLPALTATIRLADPAAEARCHRCLARAYVGLGRLDNAENHLRRALTLSIDTGAQATTHFRLAELLSARNRHAEALDHDHQSLQLYRAAGNVVGEANVLNGIGWHHALLGQYESALTYCQQALALFEKLDQPHGQAVTSDSLGYAHHRLGHQDDAQRYYRRAVDLLDSVGDRYNLAGTLRRLGDVLRDAGDLPAASTTYERALAIFTELNHPDADGVRRDLRSLGGATVNASIPLL